MIKIKEHSDLVKELNLLRENYTNNSLYQKLTRNSLTDRIENLYIITDERELEELREEIHDLSETLKTRAAYLKLLAAKIKYIKKQIKDITRLEGKPIKVYNYEVTFREFPDETALLLNISNCPNNCEGCHSPYLREDKGDDMLHVWAKGAFRPEYTCIGIMGDGWNKHSLKITINKIRDIYKREYKKDIKFGLYSGKDYLPEQEIMDLFDYVKIGHYEEKYGPLDSPTTNQIMLKKIDGKWTNITKEMLPKKL